MRSHYYSFPGNSRFLCSTISSVRKIVVTKISTHLRLYRSNYRRDNEKEGGKPQVL